MDGSLTTMPFPCVNEGIGGAEIDGEIPENRLKRERKLLKREELL